MFFSRPYLKDELTAQVNNFYSNAIGGVKLQVREEDVHKSRQILQELGYLDESQDQSNSFLKKWDVQTAKIPLLGKVALEIRLVVLAAIIIVLIAAIVVAFSFPSSENKLTDNFWCIEKVFIEHQEIQVLTTGLRMESAYQNCQEKIDFRSDGVMIFPGFNAPSQWYYWYWKEDSLHIYMDKYEDLIEHSISGTYAVEHKGGQLTLRSKSIEISAFKYRIIIK